MKQPLSNPLPLLQARWRGSPAQRLWQAWLHELRQLLPAHLQARVWPQAREHLLEWPLPAHVSSSADERLVLLLPAAMVLLQPLQLPLAATRELNSVIGFELDKYTPFPPEQLHYVARVESRGTTQAQVLLVAILRERLQAVLDACRERGLQLHTVDCRSRDGQRLGIDLLPAQQKPQGIRHSRWPRYLALACGALLLACMWLWLDARTAMVSAMQDSVDQQRQQVQQVQALRRELLNTQGAARYLAQQKAAQPTVASVLLDLTGCLGADTWVEQLEINDAGGLSISGQSAKASALISRVKACSTLSDAQFQGIIQPDEHTGKERFSLRAQLRKGATDAS